MVCFLLATCCLCSVFVSHEWELWITDRCSINPHTYIVIIAISDITSSYTLFFQVACSGLYIDYIFNRMYMLHIMFSRLA